MKKKLLRKRVIIPIVVVVAVIILFVLGGKKTAGALYAEDTATKRDITTYMKFTSKVDSTDTTKIYSSVSAKIKEVLVEEGQKVSKGDIICYLDSSDVEYSIESKELSLEQSKLSAEYNLKDAQVSLNQLQTSVNEGLNASINNAQKTLLNEQESYYAKADAYNNAMKNYLEAKADYDSGKAYKSASDSVVDAQRNLSNVKTTNDYTKKQYEDSSLSLSDSQKYNMTYNEDSAQITLQRAQKSLETAKQSALDNVNDLKKAADDALAALEAAERNMESAKRDYDTILLSVNQNLQSLRNTVDKIQATSSTASQELDIEHTKDTLDDYVIKATIDGYITTLNCKEGELFNATTNPVAIMSNFDQMELSVKVDEYDIGKVTKGMPVSIYINAFDKYFDGTIESIDMTATTSSDVSYFNTKVSFDTDGSVMSGLSAEVKIVQIDKKDVLTLASDSISYESDNTAYVNVKDAKGEMIKKTVSLGDTDGTYVEITDGLAEGDVVYYIAPQMITMGVNVN